MSEYLPKEVREGLAQAQRVQLRKRSRVRVRVGGHDFTVLRHWETGFSLDTDDAPGLRGLVDLYDGARHLSRCLIVASSEEDGEMLYEFKRATAAADRPAIDYERPDDTPVALIGHS